MTALASRLLVLFATLCVSSTALAAKPKAPAKKQPAAAGAPAKPATGTPPASVAAPTAPLVPAPATVAAPAAPDANQTTVSILSPKDNSDFSSNEVLVQLRVDLGKGATLSTVRALVDGRMAAQLRGLKLVEPNAQAAAGTERSGQLLSVPVPSADCAITLIAETTSGRSAPVTVRLRWKGAPSTREQLEALQPRLYVLAIGVSNYKQEELRLRFAAKDAMDLANSFKGQQRILYRSVEIKTLINQQASKNNILDGLEWLQRQATSKDVAVLFLAGHGITDPQTGTYYYLPYDADTEAIKRTMLPETDIRTTLVNIPGKVLLFMDTCHSGKVYAANETRSAADLNPFISEIASAENGVVVFAASTGRQASQESMDWNNGAFTKAVIEGLAGRADINKNGRITLNMLDLYISERVKELTKGRQTPTTAKPSTIPDFPIAVARGLNNEDIELAR